MQSIILCIAFFVLPNMNFSALQRNRTTFGGTKVLLAHSVKFQTSNLAAVLHHDLLYKAERHPYGRG